jgi:ankyrin repeat protein
VLDGFLDVLRILVDHLGANLEEQSANNYTILHFAAINMDLDMDIVRFLVTKCRANVFRLVLQEVCQLWVTPVTLAISAGNIAFLTCLIKEFDVKVELVSRETAQLGNVDLLRYLVAEFGVNVVAEYEGGDCCLHMAIRSNQRLVVRYLLTECHANINDQVIVWVVESGHVDMFQMFLNEFYVDIETLTFKSFLLALAVNWNHVDLVYFLLTTCQANTICMRNGHADGLSPLAVAAKKSHTIMARLLVDSGADLNWHTQCGITPLVFAAVNKNLNLIKYFVEKGAQVNHRSNLFGSVSEILAKTLSDWDDNRMEMVRYMVTEFVYADEESATTFKLTATRCAFDNGHLDIFRMLVEEFHTDISSTQDELVALAVKANRVEFVEFLLTECGAQTTFQLHGFSPLCVATLRDFEAMARCLTAHGADVSFCGPVKAFVVILAASNMNLALVKHFIHKGAQVNVRAYEGSVYDILARNGADSSFLKYIKARESCGNPGCHRGGKKRCALCKEIRYCSKECQTSHWALEHKRNCI